MTRFDLLDEFSCVAVPPRCGSATGRRASGESGRSRRRRRTRAAAITLMLALLIVAAAV